MTRNTFKPQMVPAVSFILVNTIEDTSSGKNCFFSPLYSTSNLGLLPTLMTVNGHSFMSDCTVASSKLATNQSFGIKDGVCWVHGDLVLCSISNETFLFIEGNVTWSGTVTSIVGNDFNFAVLEDSDAGVCGSKINSDCFLCHCFF